MGLCGYISIRLLMTDLRCEHLPYALCAEKMYSVICAHGEDLEQQPSLGTLDRRLQRLGPVHTEARVDLIFCCAHIA